MKWADEKENYFSQAKSLTSLVQNVTWGPPSSSFQVGPGYNHKRKERHPTKKLELSYNTKSENPNKRKSDWRNSCSTYDFKKDQYPEHTKNSETQMRKYQDSLLIV